MHTDPAVLKIALRCKWDLFFLAKHILGYELMEEEVHGEMCKYVEAFLPSHPVEYIYPESREGKEMEDQFKPGNKSALLLMPRGTFKSSVVTIGYTLQLLLNDPNSRTLIDSETYSKAKAFFSEIKSHLEKNDAYREVFKAIHEVYPIEKNKRKDIIWTDAQLNVQARTRFTKEANISCGAIDHSVNGMHFDLIICDDLHSEKNVTNSDQIAQVIAHWQLAYSLLDPGKNLIVIGTRWDYNDLYQEILDQHREDFNIMVRRAILPDGTAFFPSRLPLEELDKIKRKQGGAHFSNQYMNEPIDAENADFKRSDIVRTDWELIKDRPINWYMMVDPSFAGEHSDFAALVVAGMDYQRDVYVRHVLRKKLNYSEIIEAMFDLNNRYQPKAIAVKTVAAGGKSFMYELANEQKRRGVWLKVIQVSDSKNKEDRIRGLTPLYQFGHIFHLKDCPQLSELEDELLKFPRAKNDDTIDALATILEIATAPNAKKNPLYEEDKPKKRSPYRPRSPITGY